MTTLSADRPKPHIPASSHLRESIFDLERMVAQSPVGNVGYILGHMVTWIQDGETYAEKALPKIELGDQQRLINVLLKIIDPSATQLEAFTSPYNGQSDIHAIAQTRDKALEVLQHMDQQYRTYRSGIMPCLGDTARVVSRLFEAVKVDHPTVDLFHNRISGWSSFLSGHEGTLYRAALGAMHADAIREGDTTRMEWIDGFLRTGTTLRADTSRPAHKVA